ncbi:YqgF/RuvX protein [Commensalibacter communis]|uniref:Putative pre-16S rRNA nuclease n=1 Tax=Commensalibacter communis TaxID=2972786 RepID=A0A9W4X8Z6_9PROT|nr:Holliday junction resolvase RuvX [Commensalibacter communis]CAI3923949.1 YqgF/RuvX protein [Commensalibacter communis]CAI3923983.1 YqgF/RuvX protein [Commensalibacter communis]CAI3929387.1 YqgF/RuvX protein [Commensalibacter communis]CAI3930713.1 YqgF/RuvX protein [Commensalibacter communis]CAI3930918.1 YqgF/RuvX protein [Commensalibacter communis]
MLYATPYELIQQLPKGYRILGIDPGSKQIGLALSDVTLMLASPFATVKRGKVSVFAQYLQELAQKEQVGGLICGLPLSLDGDFGPAAQAARDWITAVSNASQLPACLWDERLSSSAVNRFLINEADLSRKKRNAVVDKMAASYTLQAALDASKNQ